MPTGIPYTETTERSSIVVAGITLQAPNPYAEGHSLRENEAGVMNQTLHENLRNNFASTVKKAQEDANGEAVDEGALQQQFDAYIMEYDFGVRRSGGARISDPVEREAMVLARAKVRQALQKKGIKPADVGKDKIDELARGVIDKYPEYMATAKANVEARQALEDSDLDITVSQPQEAGATA